MSIFHKIVQKTLQGIRHYIRFAFHQFSKYSSKINIFCGQNLYKSRLEDSLSTFVFLIGQKKVGTSWISRIGGILEKGGGLTQKKGVMTSPYQLRRISPKIILMIFNFEYILHNFWCYIAVNFIFQSLKFVGYSDEQLQNYLFLLMK